MTGCLPEFLVIWLKLGIIGIVQGITEFLPISSSAHLVFFQRLLGVKMPGLSIEIFAHLGTLGAILLVFRDDVYGLVKGVLNLPSFLKGAHSRVGPARNPENAYSRLALLIVLGSVPAAVFGLLFSESIVRAFESVWWAAAFLIINGFILLGGQRALEKSESHVAKAKRKKGVAGVHESPAGFDRIGFDDSLLIGLAQGFAILPGISRSGATICAGLRRGIESRVAASFSFLLSIPAIVGAVLFDILDLSKRTGAMTGLDGSSLSGLYIGGIPFEMLTVVAFTSFVAGYLSIHFLLRLLDKGKLRGFAVYCFLVGALALCLIGGLGLGL